jgi:hypothetical protein
MTTLSQEAAAWMVLVDAGLARMADIVRWADEKIVAADKPDPALIEISTSQEEALQDVLGRLKVLRSDVDRFEALRYAAPAIRRAIEEKRLRAESAATFIFRYLCGAYSAIPEDMRPLYSADDDFDLVAEGHGSRESVELGFIGALKNAERA